MNNKITEENDINNVLEDIFLSEEKLIENGYKQGFLAGAAEDNINGFHLGYHRGAELGAELGYYQGIVQSYLNYFTKNNSGSEKILTSLNILNNLIESFPHGNVEDVDILEEASNIRAKFKKASAQLKIDVPFPETDKLSF